MVEQLFGSKTRVKLLQLFYGNPNRSFYVREITRKIEEQINSVRRELANLLSIGIIKSDTTNNRLYYEVDQKFEYYKPLSEIFGGGAAKPVKAATEKAEEPKFKQLGNVDLLLYMGQFTRDETSGIDLLIVGDINPTQVSKFVEEEEAKEGKEIRYAVMTLDEFKYRRQINDRFLTVALASKKQVAFDKTDILGTKPREKTDKTKKSNKKD